MNKQQEPRLRFKGFTGTWEEKKVIDFSPLQRGFDLPVSKITEGDYPVVFSNGILKSHNQYKVKGVGIVTGRSGTIGEVTFVEKDFWPHNTALWVTNFFGNNPQFVFHFLKNFDLSRFATGSGVPTLNRNDVHNQTIYVPKFEEQTYLGNFFRRLDSQIAESRAVLEKSRQLKKAMLAKMFPANGEKIPKIRFKGFEGEWEEKGFESVGEFNPKTEIPQIFQYVDLESVVGTQLISYREEFKETAPSRAQRLAKNGDLFFQAVRPYQKNNYLFEKNNENFVFSTGYIQIRPQNDGYFLLTLVQKEEFVQEVLLRCTGTSYPAINTSSLQNIAILIPQTAEEQSTIGNFFRQLDETIALQSAEVEKLNQLKKGLLAVMLV